tara:strand:- start:10 stop:381 length:372 start_codon:yes stop_codon:yes gene_type:complete
MAIRRQNKNSKPAAKKPAAKKPAAKKTVAKKTVAKKTVAKKTTTRKPTAKKPAAKKPVISEVVVENKRKNTIKANPNDYIRVSENANPAKFNDMGQKVQKGLVKWSYYTIDGNVGYHYYLKLK